MAVPPQGAGGITALSGLSIDTSKDWLGYLIKNLGQPSAVKDALRQPGDDEKIYFGADSDYSLYYDSTNDEYVVYDEVNAAKLMRLPKGTTIASSLEDGGANELTAENLSTGLADGQILEASGGTFVAASKGGIFSAVTTQTADYTASSGDVVLADASGGAITITLPSPSANAWVQVKKTDSSTNAVTVDGGGNNIDGVASFDITTQYESYTMVSDGSSWFIV